MQRALLVSALHVLSKKDPADEGMAGGGVQMEEFHGMKTEVFSILHHENPDGTDLPLLTFPALADTGLVAHGFSTRLGGVSEGYFSELNLKFGNGDRREHVAKNYDRLAKAFGIRPSDFVFTDQTHTTNVRVVFKEDAGIGVTRPQDQHDIDGLVTNVPGLMLSAFFADCVPLFILDPVRRAIGLAHSGWRGTVHRMGAETIRTMTETYGTDPADLICAVGPSICQDCYEVSEDVADAFKEAFPGHEEELLINKGGGKYQLDLWAANRLVFLDAGVMQEHITVTDLCTCHHPDVLFSHRASHGKRGNLGAFLMLV